MLTYGEALTAIESGQVTSSNASEVLAAIKDNVATVLNEKRKVVARIAEMETNLQSIISVAGATGDDFESQIRDLKSKLNTQKTEFEAAKAAIATLTTEKDAIAAEKETLLKEKSGLERSGLLDKLAAKAGANPVVLAQLTKDLESEKLVLDGEEVKIDGKPLKEWLESDEMRKAFAPALFPNGMPGESPAEQPAGQPTYTPSFPSAPPTGAPAPNMDAIYAKATGRDRTKTDWITKRG